MGATTTTGLTVHAELDPGSYPTGITVPDRVMDRLPLDVHTWHGTWNYTLRREPLAPEPPAASPEFGRFPVGDNAPAWLHHPSLTGMDQPDWQDLLEHYRHYLAENPPIMIPGKKTGPGTGSRYLSASDRLLVAVLKKRWRMPQPPLAALLGTSQALIGDAVREATRVLQALDHTIPIGAITVTTADQLAAIAGHVQSSERRTETK
ncbi:hypothetical protein F7Q99_29380 [Streptomyces kaniharaensis]|uniref:Transposase family protein n=1 Tax=Streptomyces kaniharaensis TaxID=212423 RepID=A0A6N7L062_9ACTN|nr:hypothetical protein [Streptomyces kaniharaensis]